VLVEREAGQADPVLRLDVVVGARRSSGGDASAKATLGTNTT
jgi:hypothetical protein